MREMWCISAVLAKAQECALVMRRKMMIHVWSQRGTTTPYCDVGYIYDLIN